MTSREMLLAQYFPVTNACLQACERRGDDVVKMSSFNFSRIHAGLPARDRSFVAAQAGNSMTIPVIGAVLIWLGSHLTFSPCPSLVRAPLLNSESILSSYVALWRAARKRHCSSVGPVPLADITNVQATDALSQEQVGREKRRRSISSVSSASTTGSCSHSVASFNSAGSTANASSQSPSGDLLLWKSLRGSKRKA